MFKNLIKAYQNFKQSEEQRKKMYLFEKTKEHYYQELCKQNNTGLNIPQFAIEHNLKKLAYVMAAKELRKVVAECRLNECYRNCIEYTKKNRSLYQFN